MFFRKKDFPTEEFIAIYNYFAKKPHTYYSASEVYNNTRIQGLFGVEKIRLGVLLPYLREMKKKGWLEARVELRKGQDIQVYKLSKNGSSSGRKYTSQILHRGDNIPDLLPA